MAGPIERYGWAIIAQLGDSFPVYWLDRGQLRKAGESASIETARAIAKAHAAGAPVAADLFGAEAAT